MQIDKDKLQYMDRFSQWLETWRGLDLEDTNTESLLMILGRLSDYYLLHLWAHKDEEYKRFLLTPTYVSSLKSYILSIGKILARRESI